MLLRRVLGLPQTSEWAAVLKTYAGPGSFMPRPLRWFRHHADRSRSLDATSMMMTEIPFLNLGLPSNYAGFEGICLASQMGHRAFYAQHF